jgi:DNA-binding NarL/FixJ family response regulator
VIRLFIADDHAIMRSGLKQIFALTPDVCIAGEAENGQQVLEVLRDNTHDLLLLDLNMPGIGGAELLGRIRVHHPTLPILILSMHNEPQIASRMLKAGANGFITKDCEPDTLLQAVRKVAAHGKYISPELAEKMVFDVASDAQQPPHNQLSNREWEVLRLLAAGHGVNDIAGMLTISNKTVSTHKVRLMEKLNLANLAELVRYALAHGIDV